MDRYAFDASYASDQPNGRHANIGNNIAPSLIVPTEAQLSRYGLTVTNGEYLIHGIPFLGTGSSYSLVPELGIHKFNPNTRQLFISPSTLVANDINFTDLEQRMLLLQVGGAVINSSEVASDITTGLKTSWTTTHKQDSVFQTTTFESISTSDKAPYVGAMGDVYVGTSTNILIGMVRMVHPKKNVESGKYEIVLEDALATGAQVSTAFAYSQYELEKVMIPKWKDQRGQYLTQVATQADAESYVINTNSPKCVTWLKPTDDKYGEPGTYIYVILRNSPKIQL